MLASDGEVEDYTVPIGEALDIKWLQPPNPENLGWHCHDSPGSNLHCADDWLCQGGVVTDLHWWGNYEIPTGPIAGFRLSIYADLGGQPDVPTGPLWTTTASLGNGPGLVKETLYGTNTSGHPVYFYEYDLLQPFDQIPGNIYWLDIMAISADPVLQDLRWRWQADGNGTLASAVQWGEFSGVMTPLNSDLAFVITSEPPQPDLDFGDAPVVPGSPGFPTLLGNNGARHTVDGVTYLGAYRGHRAGRTT